MAAELPSNPDVFLHTLYVQEQGATLAVRGERLAVSKGLELLAEVPVLEVQQVAIMGNCQVTTPAIKFCVQRGIPILFMSERGRYYGRVEGDHERSAQLQAAQFEKFRDERFRLQVAREMVRGKLHNSHAFLLRRSRRLGGESRPLTTALAEIAGIATRLELAQDLNMLRGYEGAGAASYFRAIGQLIAAEWGFTQRLYHPAPDPVNSLLSFGYSLLYQNMVSAIRLHNLNPYVGCFHELRDNHAALASDLMEELRAPVVDSTVLYLINKRVIGLDDFEARGPDMPCGLKPRALRRYLELFEDRMHQLTTHPLTGFRVTYRRIMALQVRLLVQLIRGDALHYVPFQSQT